MHSVPMLFVHDVGATSRWYQSFLGAQSGHGGPEFEMLLADGRSLLQLHLIEAGHHEHNVELEGPLGHGLVVVIYVDSASDCFARARELGVDLLSELSFNEQANMQEFSVRDPNGYSLMICEAAWAESS